MKPFSEKLKDRRGELNLSRAALASRAGIGERTIASYECGERRRPQQAQLYKLAKALEVSPEYLRNDEIDDPFYGIERMEYTEEVRKRYGAKEALNVEEMLKMNQALFAGGTISEEAKDDYFQALMQAYLDCKQAARETFGRKKDPSSQK